MVLDSGADAGGGAADGGAGAGGAVAAGGSVLDVLTGGVGAGSGAGGEGAAAGGAADGGAAGAGDGAGGDAGGDPAWLAELSADTADGDTASLRDWAKSTGVKDLNQLAKIARDNQRALRESGRIKVPGADASPEEVAAWRKATGVPDTVEGYALGPIKGPDGSDVQLDAPLLNRLAAKAHEIGLSSDAYKALVGDYVAGQVEEFAAMEATQRADAAEWLKAQGDKQPARSAAVNRGAEVLGLDGEAVMKIRNSLGAKATMDMLARLGEGVGEDVVQGLNGSGQKFLMSGDSAQAEIDQMRANPEIAAKITVKGTPENAKYQRLQNVVGEAANRRAAAGG